MFIFCLLAKGELHIIEEKYPDVIVCLCGRVIEDINGVNIFAADDIPNNGCSECFGLMDILYVKKTKENPRIMKNTQHIGIVNLMLCKSVKFERYKKYLSKNFSRYKSYL